MLICASHEHLGRLHVSFRYGTFVKTICARLMHAYIRRHVVRGPAGTSYLEKDKKGTTWRKAGSQEGTDIW